MKMKNLLIGGMSLALVACISVGATLAYLTDKDGALTNTFKFAGITVDVTEISSEKTANTNELVGEGKQTGGINYTNLVPGQTLKKEVDVKVTSGAKVELYMLVDLGVGDKALTLVENPASSELGWTEVGISNPGKKLYKRTVAADAGDKEFDLFNNVQVPNITATGSDEITLNPIVINAYAVQADNIASTTSADQLAAEALQVNLAQ